MREPNRRRVVITGSTGYIGARLVSYLRHRGWTVEEMRRDAGPALAGVIPFSLGAEVETARLQGADGLVHCAYDFSLRNRDEARRINVDGTARLLEAAAGVRQTIVFSTMSAFEGCRSDYGRAKLEIERTSASFGAAVIRPGLVWGGTRQGLIGSLARAADTLPVIPLVVADRKVLYPAHVDDLSGLVHAILLGDVSHGTTPIIAAAQQPVSLRQVVEVLSRRAGRKPFVLPIPYWLGLFGLRGAETLGLRLPFRSDSLRSLAALGTDKTFAGAALETVRFRPFGTDP